MPHHAEGHRVHPSHARILSKMQEVVTFEFGEGVSIETGVREAYKVFGNTTELAHLFGVSRRALDQFLTKEDIQQAAEIRRERRGIKRPPKIKKDPTIAQRLFSTPPPSPPPEKRYQLLPNKRETQETARRNVRRTWGFAGIVYMDKTTYSKAVKETLRDMLLTKQMLFDEVVQATGLSPGTVRSYASKLKILFVGGRAIDYSTFPVVDK